MPSLELPSEDEAEPSPAAASDDDSSSSSEDEAPPSPGAESSDPPSDSDDSDSDTDLASDDEEEDEESDDESDAESDSPSGDDGADDADGGDAPPAKRKRPAEKPAEPAGDDQPAPKRKKAEIDLSAYEPAERYYIESGLRDLINRLVTQARTHKWCSLVKVHVPGTSVPGTAPYDFRTTVHVTPEEKKNLLGAMSFHLGDSEALAQGHGALLRGYADYGVDEATCVFDNPWADVGVRLRKSALACMNEAMAIAEDKHIAIFVCVSPKRGFPATVVSASPHWSMKLNLDALNGDKLYSRPDHESENYQ